MDGNFYRVVISTEVGTFTGVGTSTEVGTFTGLGTSTGVGTFTGVGTSTEVGTSTGQQCLAFTLKDRIELQRRFQVKYFTIISIHALRVYDLLTNS
jgi:hypothetical protein